MRYLFVSLLIGVGVFLVFVQTQGREAPGRPDAATLTWDDLRAIHGEREVLQARCRGEQRFCACLNSVKRDLWAGKTTLAGAAAAVHEAARAHHQTFLAVLRSRYPGLPVREAVALVLLTHLREESRGGTGPAGRESVPDCMRCELWSWSGVSPTTLDILTAEDAAAAE